MRNVLLLGTLLLLAPNATLASPSASEMAALGIQGCATNCGGRNSTVTVDLKSADIRRVLIMLGELGRYNVVVPDDIQGHVTLRMRNVPWRTVMREVLRAKDLDMEVEGNVILVGRAQRIAEDRHERLMREFCTPQRKLPADTFCKRP